MASTSKPDVPTAASPAPKSSAAASQDGPTTDKAVNKQINTPNAVTMAATATLNGMPEPSGIRSAEQEASDEARRRVTDPDAEVFVSEGMRQDLLVHGYANDPITGRRLTMDKKEKITVEPREQ